MERAPAYAGCPFCFSRASSRTENVPSRRKDNQSTALPLRQSVYIKPACRICRKNTVEDPAKIYGGILLDGALPGSGPLLRADAPLRADTPLQADASLRADAPLQADGSPSGLCKIAACGLQAQESSRRDPQHTKKHAVLFQNSVLFVGISPEDFPGAPDCTILTYSLVIISFRDPASPARPWISLGMIILVAFPSAARTKLS